MEFDLNIREMFVEMRNEKRKEADVVIRSRWSETIIEPSSNIKFNYKRAAQSELSSISAFMPATFRMISNASSKEKAELS